MAEKERRKKCSQVSTFCTIKLIISLHIAHMSNEVHKSKFIYAVLNERVMLSYPPSTALRQNDLMTGGEEMPHCRSEDPCSSPTSHLPYSPPKRVGTPDGGTRLNETLHRIINI